MSFMVVQLRVITVTFRLHLKQMIIDSFTLSTIIVQPLIVALLAIFMLRHSKDFQPIYVIVGSALTGLWSGTLFFSSSDIQSERWSGTLESIIGSPTHLATVMIGKSLANVLLSLSSMLLSYPIAMLLFGYSVTILHPLFFLVSLFLSVLALASMGMVFAPIMAIRPGSGSWINTLEFPVYVLSGFLFSIALLPTWTVPISYILPPYWAAYALHGSSSGSLPRSEILLSWGFLLLSCVVYWVIAYWLFRILLRKMRKEATLGLQ